VSAYTRGRAFEYRVRKQLVAEGWWVVRQARSSFPDLVAIKNDGSGPRVILVECKVDGRLSPEERDEAARIMVATGAPLIVAYRRWRRVMFKSLLE
jgi:Holliday junction resolvase